MTDVATFHDLTGKSVFITGGGSGIGAALTDGFLRQGANVTFIGRSDAGKFVAEMARKHGRAPLFVQGDITDVDGLRDAVGAAAEAHGPVEVLVNNAANDERHTTADITPEKWDDLIAVNLKAYFFATQAVAPGMQIAGAGSIINFSSISYLMGQQDYPVYTASNAAITTLSRTQAREFGPSGVRVNALAPGWVMTDKQLELYASPEARAFHLQKQCLRETLAPQDMVGPTLFLASDASRMMTGQCMVVDGGVAVTG